MITKNSEITQMSLSSKNRSGNGRIYIKEKE
jgi:hypothetical protein